MMKLTFPHLKFHPHLIARAAVLIAALCVAANAQQRNLRGDSNPNTPNKTTPRHRISYNAHGFDGQRLKAVTKSKKWLANRKADHLASELDSLESQMSLPSQIPEWIDSAWDERFAAFVSCGGKWAETARKFDPRSLRIEVMAGAWRWNGILVGGLTEGRSIKAAIITIGGASDMRSAYLNKFDAYARFEIGNALGFAAGVRHEVGVSSPCQ